MAALNVVRSGTEIKAELHAGFGTVFEKKIARKPRQISGLKIS